MCFENIVSHTTVTAVLGRTQSRSYQRGLCSQTGLTLSPRLPLGRFMVLTGLH